MKKFLFILFVLLNSSIINTSAQWREIKGTPADWNSNIHFLDSKNGWMNTSGGVYYTKDGGLTWKPFSISGANDLESIYMLDSLTGFVVGYNQIFPIKNGSDIGTPMKLEPKIFYNDIFFQDTIKGWVVGKSQYAHYTTDKGLSWSSYKFNKSDNGFNSIYFANQKNGWIVGYTGSNGYYGSMYKTENGGLEWEDVTDSRMKQLTCVRFLDSTGWVVDNAGKIFKSSVGGDKESWVEQTIEPVNTKSLKGISIVNMNLVWAVGSSGKIFRMDKEGVQDKWREWTNEANKDLWPEWTKDQTTLPTKTLYSVQFINENLGYACGEGVFLKYEKVPGSIQDKEALRMFLLQISPNPVTGDALLRIQSEINSNAEITVYDIKGKELLSLINQEIITGINEVKLKLDVFQSGTYFVTVKDKKHQETIKFNIVK